MTDARKGRAPGLVAYRDGEAVGWVSLAPRDDYERLQHSKVLARVDDKPVWSIVCFVVGRRARGRGSPEAMLGAAIDYAREHGATLLEAYPVGHEHRAHRAGQRVHGHALDVRARRLRGRRAAPGATAPFVRAPSSVARPGSREAESQLSPTSIRIRLLIRPFDS